MRVMEERKIFRKSCEGGTEIEAYEYCSLKPRHHTIDVRHTEDVSFFWSPSVLSWSLTHAEVLQNDRSRFPGMAGVF